jgi:hypothetical protein
MQILKTNIKDCCLSIDWRVETSSARISLKDQNSMGWLDYVSSFGQKRHLKSGQFFLE